MLSRKAKARLLFFVLVAYPQGSRSSEAKYRSWFTGGSLPDATHSRRPVQTPSHTSHRFRRLAAATPASPAMSRSFIAGCRHAEGRRLQPITAFRISRLATLSRESLVRQPDTFRRFQHFQVQLSGRRLAKSDHGGQHTVCSSATGGRISVISGCCNIFGETASAVVARRSGNAVACACRQ